LVGLLGQGRGAFGAFMSTFFSLMMILGIACVVMRVVEKLTGKFSDARSAS
jgi:hypothetical protein